jgi:3-oxoadipate enol-lactonase
VEGYEGCASALMGLDYLPRMGEIRIPALFIGGEHDAAAPVAVMQKMADTVHGARFVQINDAAHLSNLQEPEAFLNAVTNWLDS